MADNTSVGTGWTCQGCRAWVPGGAVHQCPLNPQPGFARSSVPVRVGPLAEDRIAAALERIADALEREPDPHALANILARAQRDSEAAE